MTCTYYNKDPLALVDNMDSYFKEIPADCSLFSDDGFELPIHKELLYQTKFMRRMLKSVNMNDCKVEILCPSVTREDLETIIKFLYGGKVYCEDQSIASQVFANLKELFGFPSRNFDFDGIVLKCEMQDPSDDKVSWFHLISDHNIGTYLRTLSLKFQKVRTKIEVSLSLPIWLSQFN